MQHKAPVLVSPSPPPAASLLFLLLLVCVLQQHIPVHEVCGVGVEFKAFYREVSSSKLHGDPSILFSFEFSLINNDYAFYHFELVENRQ